VDGHAHYSLSLYEKEDIRIFHYISPSTKVRVMCVLKENNGEKNYDRIFHFWWKLPPEKL